VRFEVIANQTDEQIAEDTKLDVDWSIERAFYSRTDSFEIPDEASHPQAVTPSMADPKPASGKHPKRKRKKKKQKGRRFHK